MVLWVTWPNQQCHSTEGWWLVNQVKGQPTRLSSLKGKEKDVSKRKNTIYIAPWRLKTQRCLEDRELNQARSKPYIVDQPVWTVRTFVYHYNSTQYCNIESFLNVPFSQCSPSSRPTCQMWPRGGKADTHCIVKTKAVYHNKLHYIHINKLR